MSNTYVATAVLICSAVTMFLRFLPFIVLGNGKKTPKFIEYLGEKLPYAVMAMLVVYCLKGISFESLESFLPAVIASAITVGSYVYKRNTLISIVLGTAVYMILLQFIFV